MPRNTSLLRFPTGMEMTKARPYQELKALKERNPNIDIKVMVDWTSPASTGDFFASKMYLTLKSYLEEKYCPMEQIWNFRGFSFKLAENRIHDKVFVVDGEKMIMGGMNIGNEYLQGGSSKLGWHDTDILFEGQAAQVATKYLSNHSFCKNT